MQVCLYVINIIMLFLSLLNQIIICTVSVACVFKPFCGHFWLTRARLTTFVLLICLIILLALYDEEVLLLVCKPVVNRRETKNHNNNNVFPFFRQQEPTNTSLHHARISCELWRHQFKNILSNDVIIFWSGNYAIYMYSFKNALKGF